MSRVVDVNALANGVLAGNRRDVGRAITLVESTQENDADSAQALLSTLMPHTGHAVRVGLSGTPGVGKSTFLEALGLWLVDKGHRVAVLAVDPSSTRNGGSILGDKTRMEELARHERAFIRPSPSQGTLGGVARRTREASLVLEAAGYDVVFFETVGTGQSEVEVSSMVDTFVLLVSPGGGDSLQGVKRGVLEVCDVLVVNKADGDLLPLAERTAADYRSGLSFFHHDTAGWRVPVVLASALKKQHMDDVWEKIEAHRACLSVGTLLAEKRARQRTHWLWAVVDDTLRQRFRAHPRVLANLSAVTEDVAAGREPPTRAAATLLELFLSDASRDPTRERHEFFD